jgi:hypothetical protein
MDFDKNIIKNTHYYNFQLLLDKVGIDNLHSYIHLHDKSNINILLWLIYKENPHAIDIIDKYIDYVDHNYRYFSNWTIFMRIILEQERVPELAITYMTKYNNINNVKLLNDSGNNAFDILLKCSQFQINIYKKFIDDYGFLCISYKNRFERHLVYYKTKYPHYPPYTDFDFLEYTIQNPHQLVYTDFYFDKINILTKYFGIIGYRYDIYNFIYKIYSNMSPEYNVHILDIDIIFLSMNYYGILCSPSFGNDKYFYNKFYKYSEPIHVNKLILMYGKY